MERRAFLAVAAGGVASAVAGCVDVGLGDGLSEDEYDVGMSANSFLPEEYEVSVGDTLVWGNNGTRGHTVTAYDSALPEGAAFFATGDLESTAAAREAWTSDRAGNLAPGETFEHTFETPGEHPYFCIPHERGGMTGVVVVIE
jgi:plastocyanin